MPPIEEPPSYPVVSLSLKDIIHYPLLLNSQSIYITYILFELKIVGNHLTMLMMKDISSE
jgi:hypothetical protein